MIYNSRINYIVGIITFIMKCKNLHFGFMQLLQLIYYNLRSKQTRKTTCMRKVSNSEFLIYLLVMIEVKSTFYTIGKYALSDSDQK